MFCPEFCDLRLSLLLTCSSVSCGVHHGNKRSAIEFDVAMEVNDLWEHVIRRSGVRILALEAGGIGCQSVPFILLVEV